MYPDLETIYLKEYIENICELSGVDTYTVERVVNTQIAIVLGDLAIKGKSDHYLGTFLFDKSNNEVEFESSLLIKDLCKGTLDPKFVLKEIIENA